MTNQTTQPWGGSGGGKAWKTFTMVFAKSEIFAHEDQTLSKDQNVSFFCPRPFYLTR